MSYIIFTDGSSRGNPGPGGWGAIIAEYSNKELRIKNKEYRIREIGGREENTTNNRMEMTAAIYALKSVSGQDDIQIFTDSAYLINGITKWVHGWQKNNWQTKTKDDVLNKDLWQELVSVSSGKNISWHKVSGHAGVPANERCDMIATSYADGVSIQLFHGDASAYSVDLSVTEGDGTSSVSSEDKARKKTKAYSYVSMVGGDIQVHETWGECEARVKGVSGARFKKSVSKEDEKNIIASFEALM